MKVLLKRLSLNSQTQKLEPPSRRLHHSFWERKSLQNMPFLLIAQWSYMVMDELLGHVVSPCITRKTDLQLFSTMHPSLQRQSPITIWPFHVFSCAKCYRLSLILFIYCYFFLSNFSGDLLMKVKVQCPAEGAASVVLLALI